MDSKIKSTLHKSRLAPDQKGLKNCLQMSGQISIQPFYFPFTFTSLLLPKACSLVLESVDEILWCDHSNETSSAVLLHGTICFSLFFKMKFVLFLAF